ncbi:MAG TPA: homocysteine S-methyltransferase family protein [Anaerolineae bacterium]|jgi:homocysteine S-methyltransferase
MQFETFIQNTDFILAEGSVYERLRRHPSVEFDPHLAYGTFIYEPDTADVLESVHREYLDIGQRYGLPMIATTPTWRANQERINRSRFKDAKINQDNVQFMLDLRASYPADGPPIFIAGIIGPRGDAYRPDEAPSKAEAERFHAAQIEALAETRLDLVYIATLPSFSEAQGLASAMAKTGLPYILSFVIRPSGTLLDGTPFHQVIDTIDDQTARPPLGYSVNCVHPTVLQQGLSLNELEKRGLAQRIISFMANTSAKSPEELDGLAELDTTAPAPFAEQMWATYEQFRPRIVGGCCGTGTEHIECIAQQQARTPLGT